MIVKIVLPLIIFNFTAYAFYSFFTIKRETITQLVRHDSWHHYYPLSSCHLKHKFICQLPPPHPICMCFHFGWHTIVVMMSMYPRLTIQGHASYNDKNEYRSFPSHKSELFYYSALMSVRYIIWYIHIYTYIHVLYQGSYQRILANRLLHNEPGRSALDSRCTPNRNAIPCSTAAAADFHLNFMRTIRGWNAINWLVVVFHIKMNVLKCYSSVKYLLDLALSGQPSKHRVPIIVLCGRLCCRFQFNADCRMGQCN